MTPTLSFSKKHIEFLQIGGLLTAGRNPFDEFPDPTTAALQAWFMLREFIMADHFSRPENCGSRPHGWWAYEIFRAPPPGATWNRSQQLLMLYELRQMDSAEIQAVERNDTALSANADSYLEAVQLPMLPLDDDARFESEENLIEVELACQWHRVRGRPQLAQKFADLATKFRAVLEAPVPETEMETQ